jgi:hypothetical protein
VWQAFKFLRQLSLWLKTNVLAKPIEPEKCNTLSLSAGYAFTIQFDPEMKSGMSLGGPGFSPDIQAPAQVGFSP